MLASKELVTSSHVLLIGEDLPPPSLLKVTLKVELRNEASHDSSAAVVFTDELEGSPMQGSGGRMALGDTPPVLASSG